MSQESTSLPAPFQELRDTQISILRSFGVSNESHLRVIEGMMNVCYTTGHFDGLMKAFTVGEHK